MKELCTNILKSHLEKRDILCPEKFGFRAKKSTSLAIFKILTEEINNRKLVGSIIISRFCENVRLDKSWASIKDRLLWFLAILRYWH